jgi:hypothetical protein
MRIAGTDLAPRPQPTPPGRPYSDGQSLGPMCKQVIAGTLWPVFVKLTGIYNDATVARTVQLQDPQTGETKVNQVINPGDSLTFGFDGMPFFGGIVALATAGDVWVYGNG